MESERSEKNVQNKVLEPEKWLVYSSESVGQVATLLLVKTSQLTECTAFEATNENIAVLKAMERKLRAFLKVISYDITLEDITAKKDKATSSGTLHIMRNKVLLIAGFAPNLKTLLDYSFFPFENGLTLSNNEELKFAALPNLTILSHQMDDIWQTLQGCIQAVGLRAAEKHEAIEHEGLKVPLPPSTKTQYVYYNLPSRPCKYIYMNLPDKKKAPHMNHEYINVFQVGSVYQNCGWRSCTTTKDKSKSAFEVETPPPPPPRLKAPPLPPRPRNRPPNSPLPPIPQARNFSGSPPLPLPRLPKRLDRKEIQYVVYSSKPIIGQMLVIQVVFCQKNDFETLERIKKLEEEAGYQVLKPLPDCISVAGDLKISLLDFDEECCTLKSDAHQVVEYEIVKEAILQSCWLIIEFHLEHNDSLRRNFHGKILMHPKHSKSASCRSKKEIQLSTTFEDSTLHNGIHWSCKPFNALKSIGVRAYLDVCSLMDIPCALHNDWTGLAGEVGLTVDEVFKIQSKASFPNFSPTNEVLNIWCQRRELSDKKADVVEQFKVILKKLQRFDVLAALKEFCM